MTLDSPENSEPGLLGLHAYLPPVIALAIYARLRQVAGRFARADGRSQDQRIADALAILVLGPDPEDPRRPQQPDVTVNVTVDLLTLLRLRDNPGELDRYGYLPAQVIRDLAADATWNRFVHDPVTGYLLDEGLTVTPSAALDRFITARDRYCRFPGSTRRAATGDKDHVRSRKRGGRTSARNLGAQSRRGHQAKTCGGFTLTGDANRDLTWITAAGRKYHSCPYDYRPDPDDPPWPPDDPDPDSTEPDDPHPDGAASDSSTPRSGAADSDTTGSDTTGSDTTDGRTTDRGTTDRGTTDPATADEAPADPLGPLWADSAEHELVPDDEHGDRDPECVEEA